MEASWRKDNRPAPRFRSWEDLLLPGVRRTVLVPQPAAVTDWNVTVPGGRKWRVLLALYTLTCSATAGTRNPGFSISDGDELVYNWHGSQNIAASSTVTYSWVITNALPNQAGVANTNFNVGFPSIWLNGGMVFGSSTGGLQAGDQYSAVAIWLEELYEDDATILLDRQEAELELAELIAGGQSQPQGAPGA